MYLIWKLTSGVLVTPTEVVCSGSLRVSLRLHYGQWWKSLKLFRFDFGSTPRRMTELCPLPVVKHDGAISWDHFPNFPQRREASGLSTLQHSPSLMANSKNTAIVLCMRPSNERRRYVVTSSLIGWEHTQNSLWEPIACNRGIVDSSPTKGDMFSIIENCDFFKNNSSAVENRCGLPCKVGISCVKLDKLRIHGSDFIYMKNK